MLQLIFDRQRAAQAAYVGRLDDLPHEEWQAYVSSQILALIAESVEVLEETPWKPWKASRPIADDELARLRVELVDVLHFLVNLFIAAGMDADDVLLAFEAKAGINELRRLSGDHDHGRS